MFNINSGKLYINYETANIRQAKDKNTCINTNNRHIKLRVIHSHTCIIQDILINSQGILNVIIEYCYIYRDIVCITLDIACIIWYKYNIILVNASVLYGIVHITISIS